MDIKALNKKYAKKYSGFVLAFEEENSIVITGSLDSWDEIINACRMAVDKKSGKHVVNDIKLKNVIMPKMITPSSFSDSLDGMRCDVLVIGGGIIGTSILRELSKWKLNTLLVDKEVDFAYHASGRNDGEVHPGIDLKKGSLKQHYVIEGNKMFERICHELDVPFRKKGQYVCFTNRLLKPVAISYIKNRKKDGVEGSKIVSRKELLEKEPFLNKQIKFAVYNPTAGCVSPYNLTIAYAENAVANGAKVSLETVVLGMNLEDGYIKSVKTNRGIIYPKLVINAAGCFSEDIAKIANDRYFSIHPRKGTDIIFDKKVSYIIDSIAGVTGIKKVKNTKGGGVLHTVHHNILIGPNAKETYLKEDFTTDALSIKEVIDKQKNTSLYLNQKDIITYFSGIRAPTFEEDFIIERGKNTKNIIHCAGIQSPGLTSAPAIALDIEKICLEYFKEINETIFKNDQFNPIRKGPVCLNELSLAERDKFIKKNPDYGIIVCRCEEISKGEIIDTLNSNIPVLTIDAVKRRCRPGMGRCQGSFCQPLVAKIISEFKNVDITDVRKNQSDSVILYSHTKGNDKDE